METDSRKKLNLHRYKIAKKVFVNINNRLLPYWESKKTYFTTVFEADLNIQSILPCIVLMR